VDKRDEQVSEAMSSLKGNWITAHQPTKFFYEYTENLSKRSVKAAQRTVVE
jgi:hypothetical protein